MPRTKLTPEDIGKIETFLADTKTTGNCPWCREIKWSIMDDVVEIRPFSGGSLNIGVAVYPCVMLLCNVCGYSMLFNAIQVGVVKSDKKSDVDQSAK